jgi:heme/copper-type cytochrome/quinol oxidase subunit 2
VLSRVVLGSRCGRGALCADLLAVSIRADRTFIRADRRFAVSAVAWLIVVLVLVVLVVLIGVFVRRRRRAGGVIATRRKR